MMTLILDLWFGGYDEKPRWRENFDEQMYLLERKTGLTKHQLRKVADTMQELKIVKL